MEKVALPDSPSFVDLCTLHQHAMRYYRLWIYACNIVLAVATLIFTVFAVSVLVDPRLKLLSGVEFYQPTFLYAYVALLFQCGILQAIGCLGALRLNQKLLNTYWTLLLILMIGDIIVGLFWAIRLDRIKSSLRPSLRQKLSTQYKIDPEFTQIWDWIQSRDMCCGVDSPFDFPQFNESFTRSYESNHLFHEFVPPLLPSTCCTITKWDSTSPTSPTHHTNNYGAIFPHFIKTSQFNTNSNINNGHHQASGSSSAANANSREQLSNKRHQHHSPRTKSNSASSSSSSESDHSSQQQPPNLGFPGRRKNPAIAVPKKSHYNSMEWNLLAEPLQLLYQDEFNGGLPPQSSPLKTQQSSSSTMTTTSLPALVVGALKQMTTTSTTTTSTESVSSFNSRNNPNHNNVDNNNLINSICVLPPDFVLNSLEPSPAPPSQSSLADEELSANKMSSENDPSNTIPQQQPHHHFYYHVHQHHIGCGEKMTEWVDHVTDVLFVIGFCIIVFLKGCFLAILRYEIKEMIQKIRLLNGDEAVRSAAMNELLGLTSIYGTDETSQESQDDDDNAVDGAELMNSGGKRGRRHRRGVDGPRESSTTTTTTATTTTTVMLSNETNCGSGGNNNPHNNNSNKSDSLVIGAKPFVENHIGKQPATTGASTTTPIVRKKSATASVIEEDFDSASALIESACDNAKTNFASRGLLPRHLGGPPPRSNFIPVPRNGNNNNSLQLFSSSTAPSSQPQHHHHHQGHGHHHHNADEGTPIAMVNFTNSDRNELLLMRNNPSSATGSSTTTTIQ